MVQFPPLLISHQYMVQCLKMSELFSPVITKRHVCSFYTLEVNTLNTIGTYRV